MSEQLPVQTGQRLVEDPRQLQLLSEFVDFQKQEIQVRRHELGIRAKEVEVGREQNAQAHLYAMAALQAQATDRKDSRTDSRKKLIAGCIFSGFLVLLFVGFAAYALNLGKDALVIEILKDLSLLAGGSLAGYGFGARKGQKKSAGKTPEEGNSPE